MAPTSAGIRATGNGQHILGGDCRLMVIGDSLSSVQPATSAQGWDSLFTGMFRALNPVKWRGWMTHLQRDSLLFNPTPDPFQNDNAGAQGRIANKSDPAHTWQGDLAANIFPGLGQEYTHPAASPANRIYYEVNLDPAAFPVFDAALDFRIIYDRHADGGLLSLQGVQTDGAGGGNLQLNSIDSSVGSGITSVTLEGAAGASSPNAIELRLREASVDGDQGGKFTRYGGAAVAINGVTDGLFLGAMSLGGTTTQYYARDVAGGGMVDDDRFAAFLAEAYNTNHCFIMIGENDGGLSKAAYKSELRALVDRCYAAMTTNGIAAGEQRVTVSSVYRHSGSTTQTVIGFNDAAHEIQQDDIAAGKRTAFLNWDALLGFKTMPAEFVVSGPHFNQAGSDFMVGLLRGVLFRGGGKRSRGRSRARATSSQVYL